MTDVEKIENLAPIEARVKVWLASGHVGVSSEAMLDFFYRGKVSDAGYPHDSDDLSRCIGLLNVFPEWRERLSDLGCMDGLDGKVWTALAEEWDNLEKIYALDKKKCTQYMKTIIEPLEKASGEFVHLGEGMSLRVKSPPRNARTADEMIQEEESRVLDEVAAKPELPLEDSHDVGGVSGKRLRSYIERVERLSEEKSALAEDIKEIYMEAKSVGFDTKTMRQIVKLRKMDEQKRREADELLELYKSAIGLL